MTEDQEKTIPERHRGKFYPLPKIEGIDLTDNRPFDFGVLSKWREDELQRLNMAFFLGMPEKTEIEQLLDRLKYAYIQEGDKHYITYVDNQTMKAYRLFEDSYYNGLIWPLEEVTDFTFDRWCTGMDL